MVVLDSSILLFFLDKDTPSSVPEATARVEHLIEELSAAGEKVIIPTPALSECLVGAGPAGPGYLAILRKQACFRIAAFDERAAIEAAARIHAARSRGMRKGGNPNAPKTKIKFDRMIVAIAAVEGATAIYSDDEEVCCYAREAGLRAYRLHDLALPLHKQQSALPYDAPGQE